METNVTVMGTRLEFNSDGMRLGWGPTKLGWGGDESQNHEMGWGWSISWTPCHSLIEML